MAGSRCGGLSPSREKRARKRSAPAFSMQMTEYRLICRARLTPVAIERLDQAGIYRRRGAAPFWARPERRTHNLLQVALLVPLLAGLIGLFNALRMVRLPEARPSGSPAAPALG